LSAVPVHDKIAKGKTMTATMKKLPKTKTLFAVTALFAALLHWLPPPAKRRKAYLLFNLMYRKYGRLTSAIVRIVPMGLLGKLASKISYRI